MWSQKLSLVASHTSSKIVQIWISFISQFLLYVPCALCVSHADGRVVNALLVDFQSFFLIKALWEPCIVNLWRQLLEAVPPQRRHLDKGEVLWNEGDPMDTFGCRQSAIAKAFEDVSVG